MIKVWEGRGVEDVPVSEIAEHPDNVNVGNVEAIKESMRVNGYYAPVMVQASTGYIIIGNHRFRAARELGLVTIPAIFLDVDDDQATRLMLADNRINRLGHDDLTALEAALSQLSESEHGLLGTGYTHLDLERILALDDPKLRVPPEPSLIPEELGWSISPQVGEQGDCVGLLLRHPDLRRITTADARQIFKILKLPEPSYADLADMGVPEWQ